MKNTDIALVIMIALVTTVLSYFLGNAILGNPDDQVTTVSYMNVIGDDIDEPDVESFNPDALNPTVEVYVGNCGPMEVWDANSKVCRSKMADDVVEEKDDDKKTSNDEDDELYVDDLDIDDDAVDLDTGE